MSAVNRPSQALPESSTASLGGGEEGVGFAEEIGGLAGLGEDADGLAQTLGVLLDGGEVGVEAGEHEDAAVGQLAIDLLHEEETVFAGHGDIAEEEIGLEGACGVERFLGRVGSSGFEAVFAEDEGEGVSYQTFIIDDKNTLHDVPPTDGLS